MSLTVWKHEKRLGKFIKVRLREYLVKSPNRSWQSVQFIHVVSSRFPWIPCLAHLRA